MIQKRPFLLLEILLALTLVSLCVLPLVRGPVQLYRSEAHLLEELERQRLADWTFSEIKEQLYAHAIPWKNIPAKYAPAYTFPLPDAPIYLIGTTPKIIHRSCQLLCKREKIGPSGEIFRLLEVKLLFDPPLKGNFSYRVTVQG